MGTIQSFKGLEADVVVLVGIDGRSMRRPANLYVGASRARAALYVLALADAGLTATSPQNQRAAIAPGP